ncbi:hypothetical protein [Streptomyces sp. NPDC005760]|uniref:hypothetical protein n=1 Tax=Streptomyces sp. NPDC005760 TaxID=3156718 RepID=UPI0033D8BC9C
MKDQRRETGLVDMMTAMNDFLDKLWSMEFGAALLGALAGGAFTILGSWLQARSANRATALAQAQANAQRAFDTLTELKVYMEAQTFVGRGTHGTRTEWNRQRKTLITTANSSIMLLPDAYTETRGPALMLLQMIKEWYGDPEWREYEAETNLLLSEALNFLGLFVRGSAVPEKREMTEVIAETLGQYRRKWMTAELEDLAREAENSGLDEEDQERANQLRHALGILPQQGPDPDAATGPAQAPGTQ